MGSNDQMSLSLVRVLFPTKGNRLVVALFLEHLDEQERKRKKSVGKSKKPKEKEGRNKKRRRRKKKGQIRLNRTQNWITEIWHIDLTWFSSEVICISLILLLWDLGIKSKLAAENNGSITLDNKWYGNCKKHKHGHYYRLNFLINFAHCVKVNSNVCLVYTKFNAFSYIVRSSRFLEGPIALHGFVHFLSTTAPLLTKVPYAYSDYT